MSIESKRLRALCCLCKVFLISSLRSPKRIIKRLEVCCLHKCGTLLHPLAGMHKAVSVSQGLHAQQCPDEPHQVFWGSP